MFKNTKVHLCMNVSRTDTIDCRIKIYNFLWLMNIFSSKKCLDIRYNFPRTNHKKVMNYKSTSCFSVVTNVFNSLSKFSSNLKSGVIRMNVRRICSFILWIISSIYLYPLNSVLFHLVKKVLSHQSLSLKSSKRSSIH